MVATLIIAPAAGAALAAPTMSYSGRLTEATGAPVIAPVNLELRFFRSRTGQDEVAVGPLTMAAVTLQDGVFQIDLELSDSELQSLFPSAATDTWIEVTDTTHVRTYPRQSFSIAPYALKVPIDDSKLAYTAEGKLTVTAASGNTLASPTISGKVLGPSGDAAHPGYTYAGDPDTGLWSPGSDLLAVSTGGSERLRVDASGKVGIGTTDPSSYNREGWTSQATITNSSGDAGLTLIGSPTSNLTALRFGRGNTLNEADRGAVVYDLQNDKLGFVSARTTRMTINSSGNVGIGTTGPVNRLSVSGDGSTKAAIDGNELFQFHSGSSTYGTVSNDTATLLLGVNDVGGDGIFSAVQEGAAIGSANNTPFHIRTNNTERLRVDTSGNVGIGTTTPQTTLDINGTARLAKYASQPFGCDAAHDGAIALGSSSYTTCVCKGGSTSWVKTSDGATACGW